MGNGVPDWTSLVWITGPPFSGHTRLCDPTCGASLLPSSPAATASPLPTLVHVPSSFALTHPAPLRLCTLPVHADAMTPPPFPCSQLRRRGRRHPLVASVATATASAAATLFAALFALPPPVAADSTTAYTHPAVGGSPTTCAGVSVIRAVGLDTTCPADLTAPSGSPFLVAPDLEEAANAVGYEHEELYTWDGLPPVHVGDTLGGGNYTVVAKLGSGSFSTVWAAYHMVSGRRVAIKLWRAADWTTEMAAEENMYLHELAVMDPSAAFPVMRLLDSFVHVSAHGRHSAAVLELMGVNLRVALHAYLYRPGAPRPRRRGAPVRVITTIVRQLLQGLSLAHHHRLLHTDLKLENVALRLPSPAEAAAANAAAAAGGAAAVDKDGGDGGGGGGADLDAEVAAFWSPGGVPHAPGRIAIIDWGNTERLNEDYILPFSYQLQTESYRAPETIAGVGASPGTDLWSVGCMVWDLAVGKRLFRPNSDTPWGRSVDHLALMADVLGSPDHTFPTWFLTTGVHAGELFEVPAGFPLPEVDAPWWLPGGANNTTPAGSPPLALEDDDGTLPPPRLRGIDDHAYTSVAALLASSTDYHPAVQAALVEFLSATLSLDPNARPPAATLLATSELLNREWTDEEVGVPPSTPSPEWGHVEGERSGVLEKLGTLLDWVGGRGGIFAAPADVVTVG